jgi:peptidoglycan DL-endopeptidase CwlO
MALVVIIGVGFTSVHADPSSDKAKIQQIQTQRMDLENKVEMMDNQIESIMSKINTNENNISATQKNIKLSQIEITKAENNIKTEQKLFNERMRVMYMSGSSSYVEVVMGSKDLGDFISRLDNLEKIMKFDQSVINDYKIKKSAINFKKVALNIQNTKLLSLKAYNNNKLADLTKQKSDQTIMVAQLKTQESQYSAKLLSDQASVAASQVAIQQIRDSAPSTKNPTPNSEKSTASVATPTSSSEISTPASVVSTPSVNKNTPSVKKSTSNSKQSTPSAPASRGTTVISSNSVIAYASNFLGIPYVWGGSSPSGFDCSGFTQYVFAHFGVNLPRVSEAQQNVGAYVSRNNLKPGDLVFFGNPAYHVGIYVGNGNMIDAPHTGTVIKIQKLNSDFTCGRRVN